MHPLVRDLYKRVLIVGRDYPMGLNRVKSQWKPAMRNPSNCPSWYDGRHDKKEEEILFAVHKGRQAVKEMIGIIQLKKYRSMKQRYDDSHNATGVEDAMSRLENQGVK